MFKLETIGGILQAKQNPRTKAVAAMQIGIAGTASDQTGNFTLPADAAAAKLTTQVVWNKIDKPEVENSKTYTVAIGDYVRALDLKSIEGLRVELDYRVISTTYANVAKGDVLVVNAADGKWVEADGVTIVASQYIVNLVVDEKTTYGDNGVLCTVKINKL